MNKKKKWIITAVILVVFCLALGLYNLMNGKATVEPDAAAAVTPRRTSILNVNGLVIRPQQLTDGITTVGNLLPDEEVDLSFETSGKIVAINFREGTAVKKGDLLAKVNDQPLLAQLRRYEAQLKLAEDRVYRQSALLEKDAVSPGSLRAGPHGAGDAQCRHRHREVEHRAHGTPRAVRRRNRSQKRQRGRLYASPSVVVAKLAKIQPLKIDLFVPERYANQIKPGTKLSFTVDGQQATFQGSVYATESKIDLATHTFAVRAHYSNAQGRLLPGRFVTVQIRLHDIPNAIAIPTEAIVPEMGVDKVYLCKGGRAHAVEVTTGLRTDAEIQILKGLNVGDTLITSGTLQLREGLPVKLDTVE